MNIRRIGEDGKTSEMRRTGRRWRKSLAPFGEKDWFCKIGEDGVSAFASRITPGIFVGHRDSTGEVLCITKNGVWGKIGRDRHWKILGMLRTGVACVARRGKWWLLNCSWQKEVTAYKEGGTSTAKDCCWKSARGWPEKILRVVGRHRGSQTHWHHMEERQKPHNNECRERIRTVIERILTVRQGWMHTKTDSRRQSEWKKEKELE